MRTLTAFIVVLRADVARVKDCTAAITVSNKSPALIAMMSHSHIADNTKANDLCPPVLPVTKASDHIFRAAPGDSIRYPSFMMALSVSLAVSRSYSFSDSVRSA